jgi:Mrp family chromosome partitioning ATPase
LVQAAVVPDTPRHAADQPDSPAPHPSAAGRHEGRDADSVSEPVSPSRASAAPEQDRAREAQAGELAQAEPRESGEADQTAQREASEPSPRQAGARRVVVLGCTSGAGQTVTALMTARLLASLQAEPIGALDLNPGEGSLEQRASSPPVGSLRELLGGTIPAASDGRAAPGFEVIGAGVGGVASVRALDEQDFAQLGEHLAGRYRISVVDPGASAVSRVLGLADQLVLVAPASGDAPRAVSMTRQWLEEHDHRELAANAVMVVNGVSSRSMGDVEQAEAVVAGRCRAIIRVPWDDHLGADGGCGPDLDALAGPTRDALTSLATLLAEGSGSSS